MAKERPILFSAPMVNALLQGRKTVTRRIVKPKAVPLMDALAEHNGFVPMQTMDYDIGALCPYGQPGDRLWVRESFLHLTHGEMNVVDEYDSWYGGEGCQIEYAADGAQPRTLSRNSWMVKRPSIHMPRWASRLSLEITGVKVERLQDITEESAIAEGIERINDLPVNPLDFVACWKDYTGSRPYWNSPIDSFHSLWESINGAESWKSNPFVWAVSFTRLAPMEQA